MSAAAGLVFLAVEVGTTGARACAVDLAGRMLDEARRPYRTVTPHPGWAEQDPRDWREMALAAAADLTERLGPGARIAAIGLTGQCPTVAPFDAGLEPVGPGLLYRDNRASAEALEMRRRIGVAAMHERTGHAADAFHVGPKILWLRRHRPEAFARTRRFLQPRDVVLHALTGAVATDQTHANATVFYDLRARAWAGDLLALFDLDAGLFPAVLPPWAQAGTVSPGAAARTGLPAGCPVIVGAADSQCAAFGSGVVAPGPISEMAGASSCLNSIVLEPLADEHVTHYSHVVPDCFSTEIGLNTTGAALSWAVASLGYPDFATFDAGARRVHAALRAGDVEDPLAAAPVFLPYLGDGERSDVTLRAGFLGLSDRHGPDALAYAVVEGVAFGVAEVIDQLTAAGSPCTELRVAGGGARLPTVGAVKADALGVPVCHLQADSSAVGVALLAARGTGHAAEADAAIAALVRAAPRFDPDPAGTERLALRRAWFRRVRAADAVRLGAPPTEGAGP